MALIDADQVLRFVSGSGSDLFSGQSSTRGVSETCELHVDGKQEKFVPPHTPHYPHAITQRLESSLTSVWQLRFCVRHGEKIKSSNPKRVAVRAR